MTQGNYVSENTNDLIRRAQQTLGGSPVLDLTNWQSPTYTHAGAVRYLAGSSCHSIKIKNVITVTDSSIIKCTTAIAGSCGIIPADCDAIGPTTPDLFYNFVAKVDALVAQNNVEITFKFVRDGTPQEVSVLTNLIAGSTNTVYAYIANQAYPSDTELVLYGAEATNY